MVVVSGSWMKNAQYADYVKTHTENDIVIPTSNTMCAKAVLLSRPNSHPFQDRTLSLEQPIKVGRAVARVRATSTNAIFDCKVLSRHHALLWYECGKFFLQDTNSSNGTFVNNNRLAPNETEPHEVSSGDIVQFGVDVVENNRKVTHGCIIAVLKLYLPDGKEAKASPSTGDGNRHGMVPLDDLYKLSQIIQEASQREQCLETKLTALQQVVESTRRSAEESWQAYIGEEKLLSRIAALETQFVQASKGLADEKVKEELDKLQVDRAEYQLAAKDALQKLHVDRLQAIAEAAEQQRARATAEQEAILVKEQLDQVQEELQALAQKLTEVQKKAEEEKVQMEQKEKELQARLETSNKTINKNREILDKMFWNQMNEMTPESIKKYKSLLNNEGDVDNFNEDEDNIEEKFQINGIENPDTRINTDASLDEDKRDIFNEKSELTIEDSNLPVESVKMENEIKDTENTDELKQSRDSEDNMKESNANTLENTELKNDMLCEQITQNLRVNFLEKKEGIPEVDSKTLKFQNELRKQLEHLDIMSCAKSGKIALLEECLLTEKEENTFLSNKTELLKKEFDSLKKKYFESVKETTDLRTKVNEFRFLVEKLDDENQKLKLQIENKVLPETSDESLQVQPSEFEETEQSNQNISHISTEEVQSLEEELVLLKERYAELCEEKIVLNKELLCVRAKYNALCDRSYNNLFFYVAPLVLMVLYLLISSICS